jgi:hypothetical protein
MKDAELSPNWLDRIRARFAEKSKPSADDWSAALASERGSFATFLGMTLTDARLLGYAIGDTVLFVIWPSGKITMHPEMAAHRFNEQPALLCSRPGLSAFDDTRLAFENARFILRAPPGGWRSTRLVAVTDALGEWITRAEEPPARRLRLEFLAGLRTHASFEAWTKRCIAAGHVRRDDCALLVIDL